MQVDATIAQATTHDFVFIHFALALLEFVCLKALHRGFFQSRCSCQPKSHFLNHLLSYLLALLIVFPTRHCQKGVFTPFPQLKAIICHIRV
jgi:hypothetical protein